jgi:hypothetical protein
MKKRKEDFIYAYDDEAHEIIIIDAETGERIEQKNNRVVSILKHLHEQEAFVQLRKFALWCARECNTGLKPVQRKFIEAAEKAIRAELDTQELQQLYSETEGEAVATDSVGLRQGSEKAPGFLASRECINPDAFGGAKNAARFHSLWAEISYKNKDHELPAGLRTVTASPVGDNPADRAEQEQVDYLLDLMGE